MKMNFASVHNVVNQSYEHFLEGEIFNLDDKIQRVLDQLSEEKRQKITAEDLKKDEDFSRYQLDTIETYLKKHKKREL